jgi:two-component system, NarL family, sensor histidine kinase UhpB
MWNTFSLRTRLFLPVGAMFVAALVLGIVSLRIFAVNQLIEENEPAARSARLVADALNKTLELSPDPQHTLEAFGQSLGTSEAIQFRRVGTAAPIRPVAAAGASPEKVPEWFLSLITFPDVGASFPIMIEGSHAADIVFSPDISAEVFEKWIGFLAIALSGVALMLLTGLIAYFTTGAALRPLADLGKGLTRMSRGNFEDLIPAAGPPEIRGSCEEANELARTLSRLSRDNRNLLRKIVSLQDDERRDLARELHDELGPLLFGIRANTVSLLEAAPRDKQIESPADGVMQSVEALQQANRRILDRLRPLYIHELGLEKSIHTLLRNTHSQAPEMKLTSKIDDSLTDIDGILSQTVYRVIQEGVTNVLRHAKANAMNIEAAIRDRHLLIEISDDGVGFPDNNVFGRGLTGMHERVRALSGTFQLLREGGRTYIRCRLPVGETNNMLAGVE